MASLLAIGGIASQVDINVVQYVVALIGPGVAIDYCLPVVTRWREERGPGTTTKAPSPARPLPTASSGLPAEGEVAAISGGNRRTP